MVPVIQLAQNQGSEATLHQPPEAGSATAVHKSQATAAGHAGVVITGQLGQARAAGQTGAVGWKLHAPNRVATSMASGDPAILGPAGCCSMSIRVLFPYETYGLLSRLHL